MHPFLKILDHPFVLMGIVNVTPDSFYDGGAHASAATAMAHARKLVSEGAHILDIGGESTRPGAEAIDEEEECRRILPVIEACAKLPGALISVDTSKAAVARRALDAGATLINDISAGRFDPAMAALAASRGAPVVLMHSRKTPATMQTEVYYADVVAEVKTELRERIDYFLSAGVKQENIILDPGIGFAKRYEDNIALLQNLGALAGLGYHLLIGTSRKAFIGQILGKPASERLFGSLATLAVALDSGAKIFRVHDVGASNDFLKVYAAMRGK
ncbi:MAG: dihydropteroate synthase [Chitinivibrionales bacterium]|nr:dihydropteroate synthase [Chitinivibrionales bacterium]